MAAQGATEVSGAVSADTVWTAAQSPYLVTADLSVANGARLRIEPGVVVYMNPGANLTVSHGALRAVGAADSPIVFTSAAEQGGSPLRGDWGQLVFLDDTLDADTLLDGVVIRYGRGIRIERASPTLNRLKLRNNSGAAVSVDLQSSPMGAGLQAEGNDINGILVPAGEIDASVQWRLQGIPYVLASGELSIGKRPTITGISPASIQQGQTMDAVISGSRLLGAERVVFDGSGLVGSITSASTDSSIPVRVVASASQALGGVGFEVQTAAGSARFDAGLSVIPVKPTIDVSGVTPASLRREETKSFTLAGNNLQGASISVPAGVGLSLANLQTTPTQATFSLSAASGASLGAQVLTVTNPAVANGSATATVAVMNAFPKVVVSPSPLVVPPDGSSHAFSLQLTSSDAVAHVLNLSPADPTIASVSPSSVTVPAGETQATVSMTGLKLGYTVLNISSPTLAAIAVPVYVTNALNTGASIGPLSSMPVGVERKVDGSKLPPGSVVSPLISMSVGVERATSGVGQPIGTSLGPVASSPVGVARALDASSLPDGMALGPVLSSPVGVERAEPAPPP